MFRSAAVAEPILCDNHHSRNVMLGNQLNLNQAGVCLHNLVITCIELHEC